MKQWFYLSHLLFSFFFLHTHARAESNFSTPTEIHEARKIDINTADVSILSNAFKGIGKKRAEAIVHFREAHGVFKSVEELAKVRGVGEKFVKRNATALNEIFTVNP